MHDLKTLIFFFDLNVLQLLKMERRIFIQMGEMTDNLPTYLCNVRIKAQANVYPSPRKSENINKKYELQHQC